MKYRIYLCFAILLTISSCSTKPAIWCEKRNDKHVGECEQIINEAYLYSILSANSYDTEENTPFILPEHIREVRHEDSQLSRPSPEYINSKVYDNGSFQAKVFEIQSDGNEDSVDTIREVVIAYRGTEKFPVPDIVHGTITHDQRQKAVRLYEEIKNKYAEEKTSIRLTGHSLGGALAMEVAYTYPEDGIQAYVFDASYQITFWKKYETLPNGGQVNSIEETNDAVVGPPRLLWKKPKGLNVYKVDYVEGLKGNHSHINIALGLLKEAKENGVASAIQIFNLNQKLYP